MIRNRLYAITLLGAALLASCGNDPGIEGASRTLVGFIPAISRASDTEWTAGDRVGIFMLNAGAATIDVAGIAMGADNKTYIATAGTQATLAPADASQKIYYPNSGQVDFIAYYPHSASLGAGYTYNVDVADQSDPSAIDLLWAKTTGKSKSDTPVALQFSHKMGKVRINVINADNLDAEEYAGITAKITGMPARGAFSLSDGLTWSDVAGVADITPLEVTAPAGYQASFDAIVVPHDPAAFTGRKVRFAVPALGNYVWDIPADLRISGGQQATFNLKVGAMGVELVEMTVGAWTDAATDPAGADKSISAQEVTVAWPNHPGLIRGVVLKHEDTGNIYICEVDPATGKIVSGLYEDFSTSNKVWIQSLYLIGRDKELNISSVNFTQIVPDLSASSYPITLGSFSSPSGAGTQADPYLVANRWDLEYIKTDASSLGKHYKQVCDIDLGGSATPFTPVGNATTPFTGSYDGDGYTINNMAMTATANVTGLFGQISATAALRNIVLGAGCTVDGGGFSHIGGVCGGNYGTIAGCVSHATVSGIGAYIGGIAGYNFMPGIGSIIGCANYGAVTGIHTVGGICGTNGSSHADALKDCRNYGAVRGTGDNGLGATFAGGIAGETYAGGLTGCVNSGAVSGARQWVGGIAGYIYGTITSCANSGAVSGEALIGGIAGLTSGSMTGCSNSGAVTGLYEVGGIAGLANNPGGSFTLQGCTNTGAVTATGTYSDSDYSRAGGICGLVAFGATLDGCTNSGTVTAPGSQAAGIAGRVGENGKLTGCTNAAAGAVTGLHTVGGIAGYCESSASPAIEGCHNHAAVTVTNIGDDGNGGGICGHVASGAITACSNLGVVNGGNSRCIGGIGGYVVSSQISACKNSGAISGERMGGICGCGESGTEIIACYNTGRVENANARAGGIISQNNGILKACYNIGHMGTSENCTQITENQVNRDNVTWCYWNGTGTTVGVATESSNCYKFSGAAWPENNEDRDWGVWDGVTPASRPTGCWWRSLGRWSVAIPQYPKLYWEED